MFDVQKNIIGRLSELLIAYEWLDIDPDFADTEQFCQQYGFSLKESANTIIVGSKRGNKKYCACLVLAPDKLDVNRKVKSLMEVSRLSFAKSEETTQLTKMMIGGVTVVGLPEHLPIYIDSKVMEQTKIIIGGGTRSGKIILSPSELKKIPGTQVIDNLSITIT